MVFIHLSDFLNMVLLILASMNNSFSPVASERKIVSDLQGSYNLVLIMRPFCEGKIVSDLKGSYNLVLIMRSFCEGKKQGNSWMLSWFGHGWWEWMLVGRALH